MDLIYRISTSLSGNVTSIWDDEVGLCARIVYDDIRYYVDESDYDGSLTEIDIDKLDSLRKFAEDFMAAGAVKN